LPIVFIHRGTNDYLAYSVAQAHWTNPNSSIFLLGDDANVGIPFAQHFAFKDYFKRAYDFSLIYQHYSDNPPDYELFCIQRWLILNDFMHAHNIDSTLYLDSDVLIYSSMTEMLDNLPAVDLGIAKPAGSSVSPAICFLLNREVLDEFCELIVSIYKSAELTKNILEDHYRKCQIRGVYGGACDMTLFDHYLLQSKRNISNLLEINSDNYFDASIFRLDDFESEENGMKKIIFDNGIPFCIHKSTGHKRRFHNLHFQGASKA
ncbi:MAG: hypothetical protein KDD53_13070, partial [Bdellovibrionales bacterium]|nr:hypothetical protein [Bdellovibrionales bacterium]